MPRGFPRPDTGPGMSELFHDLTVEQEEQRAVERLAAAVRKTERDHPLPRCRHGKALLDGGGEKLEPPCGCRFDKGDARPVQSV